MYKTTRLFPTLLFPLLTIPLVHAAEEESCGLTNLATCIPQKFFEFLLGIINAPLQSFLTLTKNFYRSPSISRFLSHYGQ